MLNGHKGVLLTLFPRRGIPQPRLSAAARLGRPARATGSSADCATWWSWSPRPRTRRAETVGTSAVPRVILSFNAWPAAAIQSMSFVVNRGSRLISVSPRRPQELPLCDESCPRYSRLTPPGSRTLPHWVPWVQQPLLSESARKISRLCFGS